MHVSHSKSGRKRVMRTLCLSAIAVVALPGSAWADDIVNNLDGTADPDRETLNLTVPNGGSTTIKLQPTGGDGEAGCNLQNNGEYVKFSVESSNTSVATVSAAELTFENCNSKTVTVTAVSQGSADITFKKTASNVAASFNPAPANFTVNVSSATVQNRAPAISGTSGDASVNEGTSGTYSVNASDADGDQLTYAWTVSQGIATINGPNNGSSVNVGFPDGPSGVVLNVAVSDGKAPAVNAQVSVAVANVAPSIINWQVLPTSGTACIGGNTVRLSFDVDDPAVEAYDAITGTAFNPFVGRSVLQSKVFGPGTSPVSASANDGDGGTDSESSNVSFLYSTSGGFPLAPINTDGSSNFKLGSTIPVKLRIVDCQGQPVAGLAPQINLVKTSNTVNGAVNEPVDTASVPDDGKTMRYDAAAGQYIYNLSTKRSVFATGGGALDLGRYTLSINGSGIAAPPSVGFDILK